MADVQTFGKLDFNMNTQIMELQIAYAAITLQEIYDSAHDAMANLNNMDERRIAKASGQDDLGSGLMTGLTVELLNGWRTKAADRGGPDFVRVSITGGNLITAAANGPDPTDPLAPANYVTYSLSKAVSATITADVAEWTQAEKDALPGVIWSSNTRRLTDRYIDPSNHISSQGQVEEVKGTGFDSDKDTLVKIREAVSKGGGAGFQV